MQSAGVVGRRQPVQLDHGLCCNAVYTRPAMRACQCPASCIRDRLAATGIVVGPRPFNHTHAMFQARRARPSILRRLGGFLNLNRPAPHSHARARHSTSVCVRQTQLQTPTTAAETKRARLCIRSPYTHTHTHSHTHTTSPLPPCATRSLALHCTVVGAHNLRLMESFWKSGRHSPPQARSRCLRS